VWYRNRQCDRVFARRRADGGPTDVYQIEVQLKRTEDFQERMVSYWATLATKYRRATHRIHQVVLWPEGGGYPGRFERDRERLEYYAVNIPDDYEPETFLASGAPAMALFTRKPPHDLVERVTDQIAATEKDENKLVQIELGMLVGGSLATQLVEALRRRGMSNILEQTETGREIARKNREEGRAEGRDEGRAEGREEGRVDSMRAVLRAAYGDISDLDELARRLADRDHSGNIARIVTGAALDDLRA
jgi:predicted transposase YdaD